MLFPLPNTWNNRQLVNDEENLWVLMAENPSIEVNGQCVFTILSESGEI